ncbi:MAG: RNA polymerase sigma factor [Nannocystaceae bacterium]|nr:sigma-70 family RNA polymerase sigma factor [bacterium]
MSEPESLPHVDLSLLTRWRAGDRRAGSELIDRYDGLLLRFFQTKAGDDAEDLVQRTFLRCIERKDAIVDLTSFRAYLLATARTVLVDHYRKAGRHARRFDPLQTSVADLNPSLSTHAAMQQERRQLVEALRQIPMELQIALELFYWEGMAGPELAAALGLPEGTLRTRLRRGRQLLRERLGDHAPRM